MIRVISAQLDPAMAGFPLQMYVAATLFHCIGLDPHQELMTSSGRPVQLFREGKVIEKLLA